MGNGPYKSIELSRTWLNYYFWLFIYVFKLFV